MELFRLCILLSVLGFPGLSNAAPSATPASKYPSTGSKHLRPVLERRQSPGFSQGQPDNGKGKGGPLNGTLGSVLLSKL
jgi:hypothetical protein